MIIMSFLLIGCGLNIVACLFIFTLIVWLLVVRKDIYDGNSDNSSVENSDSSRILSSPISCQNSYLAKYSRTNGIRSALLTHKDNLVWSMSNIDARSVYLSSKGLVEILTTVQKICPVSTSNGWHVRSVINVVPLYDHHQENICSVSLKASVACKDVLEVLKCVDKWKSWSPFTFHLLEKLSISKTGIHNDIVGQMSKAAGPAHWVPWFATRRRADMFHRYWASEENDLSWMLLYNMNTWQLYTFQPVLNSMDPNCCQLSIYQYPISEEGSEVIANTLCLLKTYIENENLEVPRLAFRNVEEPSVSVSRPVADLVSRAGAGAVEEVVEDEEDECVGRRASVSTHRNGPGMMRKSSSSPLVKFLSHLPLWSSRRSSASSGKRRNSDINLSLSQTSPTTATPSDGVAGGGNSKARPSSVARVLEYAEDDMDGGKEVSAPSPRYVPSSSNRPLFSYQDIAVHCASELIEEVAYATHVDLNASEPDQFSKCGGWMFYNLDKDVLTLHKKTEGTSPGQRFLCKGIIECSPKDVFETVKNPLVRFTYDDTAKKVTVLEEVGEGKKIVHQQHESSLYVVRRSLCDFCILQNERIDGQKYMITLNSIEHAKCPVQQDVFRGMVLPSGWVIEPLIRQSGETHCVVTYYIQMDVGSSAMMEEIVLKQTQCISYLRIYMTPMASLRSS